LSLLEKVVGEALTLGELVFREKLARGTIQSIEVMAKSESRALKQGHRRVPASDLAVLRTVNREYRKQLKDMLKIERDDLETVQTRIELTNGRLEKLRLCLRVEYQVRQVVSFHERGR